MSVGNIPSYQGSTGVVSKIVGGSGEVFLAVYNNTASTTYTNGDVYNVSYAKDSTSGYFPILATPATDSVGTTLVGIVNNSPLGTTSFGAGSWGYVQISGYCEAVTTDGSGCTAEHALKCGNAAIVATDEATATLSAKSFAIAKSTVTAGLACTAFLLGFRVTV